MHDQASLPSPEYIPELKQRLNDIKLRQDCQARSEQNLDQTSISVLVEEYKCQDDGALCNSVGRTTCQTWKMRVVGTKDHNDFSGLACWMSPPTCLEVEVARGCADGEGAETVAQVCIRLDDVQVFPERGNESECGNNDKKGTSSGPMSDDFVHEWKFCGFASGIGKFNRAERWLQNDVHLDKWRRGTSSLKCAYHVELDGHRYPAVLTQQRADGLFELEVFQKDERGATEQQHYPGIGREHILVSGTDTTIDVPECSVSLLVPRSHPRDVQLNWGDVSFSNILGRTSPRDTIDSNDFTTKQRIFMDVPRNSGLANFFATFVGLAEKEKISVNAGPSKLNHFLSGEVRRGNSGSDELSKWWTLQLGPFAEHTVQIERRSQCSPIHTLTVDDQVLLECTGEDIGCAQGLWQCSFRFVGERQIEFNVFEKTSDGIECNSKNSVVTAFKYEHVVCVSHQLDQIFSKVSMTIDNVAVEQLPAKVDTDHEPNVSITLHDLSVQYGLQVPEKIVAQRSDLEDDGDNWWVWEDREVKETHDSDRDSLTDMKMKEGKDSDSDAQCRSETSAGYEWNVDGDPELREGYDCDWDVADVSNDSGYDTDFVDAPEATPDAGTPEQAGQFSRWVWGSPRKGRNNSSKASGQSSSKASGRSSPLISVKADDEWSRATSTDAQELAAELDEDPPLSVEDRPKELDRSNQECKLPELKLPAADADSSKHQEFFALQKKTQPADADWVKGKDPDPGGCHPELQLPQKKPQVTNDDWVKDKDLELCGLREEREVLQKKLKDKDAENARLEEELKALEANISATFKVCQFPHTLLGEEAGLGVAAINGASCLCFGTTPEFGKGKGKRAPPPKAPPPKSKGKGKKRLSKLKPLGWQNVKAVQGTVWAATEAGTDIAISEELMGELFPWGKEASPTASSAPRKKNGASLAAPHRCMAIRVGLHPARHLPLPDLRQAILALDETVLIAEVMETLLVKDPKTKLPLLLPTTEEISSANEFVQSGQSQDALDDASKYILAVHDIPDLHDRLLLQQLRVSFHERAVHLIRQLQTVGEALRQVRDSQRFSGVLFTILKLGNMLNQGTARGEAAGFRMSSLGQLSQLKQVASTGGVPGLSLLDLLVQLLEEQKPDLLNVVGDMPRVQAATRVELKEVKNEIDSLREDLDCISRSCGEDAEEGFRAAGRAFISRAEGPLATLDASFSMAEGVYAAVLRFFGEKAEADGSGLPSHEWLAHISSFLEGLRQSNLRRRSRLGRRRSMTDEP